MVLNDGQIPNPNGVRVAPGTGYHRVEGNQRESRNGPVSDLPPEIPKVTSRNFCVTVGFASSVAGWNCTTDASRMAAAPPSLTAPNKSTHQTPHRVSTGALRGAGSSARGAGGPRAGAGGRGEGGAQRATAAQQPAGEPRDGAGGRLLPHVRQPLRPPRRHAACGPPACRGTTARAPWLRGGGAGPACAQVHSDGKKCESLHGGDFRVGATPADFPRPDGTPVPRATRTPLGVVHRSRAILLRAAPNPNVPIRKRCVIAVLPGTRAARWTRRCAAASRVGGCRRRARRACWRRRWSSSLAAELAARRRRSSRLARARRCCRRTRGGQRCPPRLSRRCGSWPPPPPRCGP
jgi:hypothetical protein